MNDSNNVKIACMSDFHGNNIALNAVIEDSIREKVNMYIVAGDILTDFPHSSEIIDTLKKLTPYVVKGNREDYLLSWPTNVEKKQIDKYKQFSSIKWVYDNLSNSELAYIQSLKEQLVLEEYSIRVCHGSPFSMYDLIYRKERNLIKKSFSDINENILICGHTHIPFVQKFSEKLLINCGTVGVSFYGHGKVTATYCILEIKNGISSAIVKSVPYDFQKLHKSTLSSELYYKSPIWTELTLQSIRHKKDLNKKFIEDATKISKSRNMFSNGIIDNDSWNYMAEKWKKDNIIS